MPSWSHLSANSPCIGAGSALYATGVDVDGEPWGTPPCMGADQLTPGAATGPLSVTLETDFTNVTVGFAAHFRIRVEGQTSGNRWDFADGTLLTNRLEAAHAWQTPGTYPVQLTVFNDADPDGVTATVTVQVVEVPVFHVNPANANPAFPYTSWATAATNIQAAIGAGSVAGRVVLVTNGVYYTGGVAVWGQMTNRVALTNGVVVRSVNGPQMTIIFGASALSGTNGDGAIRCAYVGDGSVLDGFTLTSGHTRTTGHTSREQGGGGAWCERTGVVTNCVFVGNEAFRDGGGANGGIFYTCTFRNNRAWDDSGGADDAVLYDCLLKANSALGGGGASESILFNCTLTRNSALLVGGGAGWSTLNNCIVFYNSAPTAPNYYQNQDHGGLNYCCTTPLPTNGTGNLTNGPLFVDTNGWGNLRLQSNSPCINAGGNAYASGDTDLDGRPRIVSGTVDIGAYEYQGAGSVISYAWLQQYGLPTDGSADFTDSDNDLLNNWQEWRCCTDPTNALSVLRMLAPLPAGSNVNVSWQSVAGVSYFLERSTNLGASPPFLPLATNLPGQVGTTTFSDTNAVGPPPYFYRVGTP